MAAPMEGMAKQSLTNVPIAEIAPTILVIFGATGDLAQRKLYPALFDLYLKGMLPKKFQITAFGRRDFTTEAYQVFVQTALQAKKGNTDKAVFQNFLSNVAYVKGNFENDASYMSLGKTLLATDETFMVCSNKLFYLAVPPTLYETILNKLSRSGLTIPCSEKEGPAPLEAARAHSVSLPLTGWTRVLIEKPFGKDATTAARLDRLLGKLFSEEQIFRIDHYLAKETIQNILAFRFSNALFEPIWNRDHIERIEINMFEKETVGSRGAFYEGIGALRDVGQNHLLAMLSLITMEYPKGFTAPLIQKERAKILNQLVPITGASARRMVRGQYEGYRQESGVSSESDTETFFALTAYLSNKRWRGVPITLTAGKGMHESKTGISIYFKDVDVGKGDVASNRNTLTFRIQPNEGISVQFWVKKPGFDTYAVHAQTLSFNYSDSKDASVLPEAYERVLYDCVRGDQTLFASTDEMSAAWKFITPILETGTKQSLTIYAVGSPPEGVVGQHGNNKK